MSDFSEIEFNRRMSELDSHPAVNDQFMPWPDYYNDLNQLMPIAWKYNIQLLKSRDGFQGEVTVCKGGGEKEIHLTTVMEPVEAIRKCLWQIAQEQK